MTSSSNKVPLVVCAMIISFAFLTFSQPVLAIDPHRYLGTDAKRTKDIGMINLDKGDFETELDPDTSSVDVGIHEAMEMALNGLPYQISISISSEGPRDVETVHLLKDNLRCYTKWEITRTDQVMVWIDAETGEITHCGYLGQPREGSVTKERNRRLRRRPRSNRPIRQSGKD